jgi:hypothetical protein
MQAGRERRMNKQSGKQQSAEHESGSNPDRDMKGTRAMNAREQAREAGKVI